MKKFKIILVSIFIAILFLSDLLISQSNFEVGKESHASGVFNPKYAIDILLRAEIALKSATSLLFSISP